MEDEFISKIQRVDAALNIFSKTSLKARLKSTFLWYRHFLTYWVQCTT